MSNSQTQKVKSFEPDLSRKNKQFYGKIVNECAQQITYNELKETQLLLLLCFWSFWPLEKHERKIYCLL